MKSEHYDCQKYKIMNKKEIYKKYQGNRWDGYIWKSDAAKPEIISDKEFDFDTIDDSSNPFVIEGELYDKDANVSVSIRYIDGQHIIRDFDVNMLNPDTTALTPYTFVPNRMPGIEGLNFMQVWRTAEDESCKDSSGHNMKVLQPAELIFTGFKKQEDK